jgi:enoyl-[acyl-carrier protein] reductase I
VQPVADAVGAELLLPLDVEAEDEMEAVFAALKDKWGRIDILVHSIAFCPADDLHGRSPIVRAPDLRAPWTSRSSR